MNSHYCAEPLKRVARIACGLVLLFATHRASAATIVWTNIAGGNWNVAANWSQNQLPGAGDIAEITTPGTYTVTLNISPTIVGLVLGGTSGTQTLAQAGNTLTLNGAGAINAAGQLNQSAGILGGNNLITLNGTWNWSGGSLGAGAAMSVAVGGRLNMGGASIKTLDGVLTNAGTATWSGAGNFRLVGHIHNLAGAVFEIQNDRIVDLVSGDPSFINEGVIRKTAGTGTTTWQVPLINSGDLETQIGTSSFAAGSVFRSGSRFLGAGTNLAATGTITFSGDIFSENLQFGGGTLTGTNTLRGTMNWTSGTIAADAAITVATNSSLLLTSASVKTLDGSLTNGGTTRWSGLGNFRLVGLVHNLAGAVFEIQNDRIVDLISGAPSFINEGVIRKTAGTGTTTWQVKLINSGVIDTLLGTMTFANGSDFQDGTRFLGTGTNVLNTGIITLSGAIYSENLQLSGATLTGSGSFTGSLDWLAGSIDAALNLSIPTNGVLRLSGGSAKTINGAITNAGTILWEGTGNLRLVGVLHNLPRALFEARNNQILDLISGAPVFVNEGVFRKTASGGTTILQIRVTNTGTIDTQTGSVTLAPDSVLNDGTRFTGAGVAVLGSGTITLNGDVFSENLRLAGATVTGMGSFVGSLDWTAGTLDAALNLSIPTNGVLRLSGSSIKTVNGSITNAGSIIWEGPGHLRLIGTLHNRASGVFEARNDAILDLVSGMPLFLNEGIFRKAGGTNITISQIRTVNLGTIEVASGTLSFSSGFTNQGGQIRLASGHLQLPGGRTLDLQGGLLTGYGLLTAHLLNNGRVSPSGTNGALTISGNYTQALRGRLEFELGGLMPGVNHSHLAISNRAHFSGIVAARPINGFVPNAGDSFQVMTFAAVSGDFLCRDGFILLGQGRRLQTQFGPISLTLTTVSAADPERPSLTVHNASGNIVVCWPSEFAGYLIQSTDDLSPINWVTIGMDAYLVIPIDPAVPERYFRLIKP